MKLAKCPYCGRRLSYTSAFMYKSKGEYRCNRCKKESNIYINKKMWLAFTLTLMVAIIAMTFIIMYLADKNPFVFLLVMIPFMIFYLFVPFFVTLRPLKKYRDFVSQQQKFIKPDILDPITDSEFEQSGPMINTDVFNQIKAKRKIITEEEAARTKAFGETEDIKKVSTDTISCDLLRDKTAAFTFKDRKIEFINEEPEKESNFFDEFMNDDN